MSYVRRFSGALACAGRRCAVAAVAVALLLTTGAAARAQVLPLLPSESMVVIKVKNLQDVSDKVGVLVKDWGLNQMKQELADPLGAVLGMTGMGAGLDKSGEAAVAIMAPAPQAHEPDVLALVPVSDYKAFVGALPNAKAEGNLTTFQPGGKVLYVGDWGKYAAISAKQALAATKGQGVQAPAACAKELDSRDVVVFANMKVIRQAVLPTFQQMKPMIQQQMTRGLQGAPNANPQMVALVTAYMNQILNVVEEFLTDSDGATFGLTLSKDGISTALLADFAPGSHLGKAFAAMKNSDASFTAGLPDGKYLVYGGMVLDPAGVQLLTEFLAPIEKAAAEAGDQGKAIAGYFAAARESLAASRQVNFGMVAPAANAMQQQAGFIQGLSVVTGDGEKLATAMRTAMQNSSAMMAASGAGNVKTVVTPGAKTVNGTTLDAFSTQYGEANTPQEQQISFMMQLIYGKNGPSGFFGKVGNDKVIQTMGGGEALATAAVEAAGKNADALATGAAAPVAAALPKQKLGAIYVPVDQIMTTVLDIMASRGMPGGVKLPPNLPPIGAAVVADGPALRVDGYIPSPLVKSLIAAGLQIYLQQMPGGAQGGGL